MATDGSVYKRAYLDAQAANEAAMKRAQAAQAAYKKNPTSANLAVLNDANRNVYSTKEKYVNAARDYRVYTDRKMLPESSGEDNIKTAILKDPEIQKQDQYVNELNKEINASNSATSAKGGNDFANNANLKTVDEAYAKQTEGEDQDGNVFTNMLSGLGKAISSAVSGVVDQVSETASALGKLAADAGDKISKLFSGDSDKNDQSKSLSRHDADKGQKETDVKVQRIDPNNHSAMKDPPSVKTKPLNLAIGPTKSASESQKKEEIPKDGALKKMNEKLEKAKGGPVSLSETMGEVTKGLSDGVKKASDVLGEIKTTVKGVVDEGKKVVTSVKEGVEGVVNTAAGIVREVTGGITAVTTPIMDTVTGVIAAGKSMSDELAAELPGPLGQYVKGKSDAFFNKTLNKVTQSKLGKVHTVLTSLSKLGESGNLTNALGTVMLAHMGKKYANVTDTSGLDLSHIFGSDADKSLIDAYYEQLTKLCPNIGSYDTIDYGNYKTLYDALLALLAQNGAAGLLKDLIACPASGNLYFDSSSINILQSSAKEVAKSGDAASYSVIFTTLGQSNLPNAKKDVVVIMANNDKDQAVLNAVDVDNLITGLGLQGKDLFKDDTTIKLQNTPVYSGSAIRLGTAGTTYYADKYLSADETKLLQAVLLLSGKK